jgi:hypothetical protein
VPTNLAIGASLVLVANVEGQFRLVGTLHGVVAPAAGFPLIEESPDGTNYQPALVIPQDLARTEFDFPFTYQPQAPYVRVTYTQGAGAGNVSGWIEARPES